MVWGEVKAEGWGEFSHVVIRMVITWFGYLYENAFGKLIKVSPGYFGGHVKTSQQPGA